MTTRWRPTPGQILKKKHNDVVDDWEQEEEKEEEEVEVPSSSTSTAEPPASADLGNASNNEEAWPALGSKAAAGSSTPKSSAAPAAQATAPLPHPPFLLSSKPGRNLLPVGPLLPSSSTKEPQTVIVPEPVPQILRRAAPSNNGRTGSSGAEDASATSRRKTLQQREKEYEEARRRIFGDEAAGSAKQDTIIKEGAGKNLPKKPAKAGSRGTSRRGSPAGEARRSPAPPVNDGQAQAGRGVESR